MKLNGQVPEKNERTIYFERPNTSVVFKIRPVESFERFHALCGLPPVKPTALVPGKGKVEEETPQYLASVANYVSNQMSYIYIWSLKATEELTWDRVKEDDPTTWSQWVDELSEANILPKEIAYLASQILEVNALDDEKLDKARKSFSVGQRNLTPQ